MDRLKRGVRMVKGCRPSFPPGLGAPLSNCGAFTPNTGPDSGYPAEGKRI